MIGAKKYQKTESKTNEYKQLAEGTYETVIAVKNYPDDNRLSFGFKVVERVLSKKEEEQGLDKDEFNGQYYWQNLPYDNDDGDISFPEKFDFIVSRIFIDGQGVEVEVDEKGEAVIDPETGGMKFKHIPDGVKVEFKTLDKLVQHFKDVHMRIRVYNGKQTNPKTGKPYLQLGDCRRSSFYDEQTVEKDEVVEDEDLPF